MPDSNSIPEGFRAIPGYPRYAIDENGAVLSVCPRNGRGEDKPWENAHRVKPQKSTQDYHMVRLCHDGGTRTITVHRLVILTFVGTCPTGMECRHLDGNRFNNHVSNLAWGTSSENANDMISHGTSNSGDRHGMAKLTKEDVLEIRARYANGEMQKAIAQNFSVAPATISCIVRRLKWKHV